VNFKTVQKKLTISLLRKMNKRQEGISFPGEKPGSIALMAQERFGDIIMMSPLIRCLHRAYNECRISIISVNKTADYLRFDPAISHVFKAKHPSAEVKRFLRKQDFDLLVNTKDHPSVTFLYLTGKIRARQKIGIGHPQHKGFFDHLLSPPAEASTVQTYLSLLDYLQIPYTEKDFIPYLPDGPVSDQVKQFVRTLPENTIAVNLSASQTYKEWPYNKWAEFLGNISLPVIIIAMPKHMVEKKELESEFSHIIPSPSTGNIFEAGQLIKHSRILLSPDTALVHIASCFNTAVLALYRQPLDLRKFPPFSSKQQVLMSKDQNIASIPVTDVLDALHKLLDESED